MTLNTNQNVETKKSNILIFFRKHLILTGFLIVVGSGLAFAMNDKLGTYSWKYKITVEVETPEGIKTGSAVREVTNRDNTLLGEQIPSAGSRISYVKGEAVVIDLGKRGVIFALIEHGSYGELYSAFSIKNPSNSTDDFNKLKLGMVASLPQENWPMFVTFKDIGDPKSVLLVRGWRFNAKAQKQIFVDDSKKIFGNGIVPKSITIEITDDPVTSKIEKSLVWLPTVKKGYLDGRFSGGGPELSNILHYGHFEQEK